MKTPLYFLLFLFLSFISCKSQVKKDVELVSADVFSERINSENIQLIDVRTPKEFKAGHLENALNIHVYDNDFEQRLEQLDKDRPIYVYCKAGSRSAEATETMYIKGFKNIIELDGGIDAWVEGNNPTVQQ